MGLSTKVIEPTTSAITVQKKQRINSVPATIIATGLGSGETVTVYFSVDDGATWEQLYLDGVAVELNPTNKAISVYSPMLLGFTKSASASPVGVYQN